MKKEQGGLRIRYLEMMNQSLLMKWMWSWLSTDNWWKEATLGIGPTYRPWDDGAASPF
jgi:hypothetical protein